MAMKKKFLGLAMAAAIALPASSVYANNTTITMDETDTRTHNVQVSGTVTNKKGTVPAGKIQVELPTTMSFSVDQNGKFTGCDFEVSNKSNIPVNVSVTEFKPSNGNITLEQKSFTKADKDRSHVSLVLNGRVKGADTDVDLSDIATSGTETEILDVAANGTGLIKLTGEAGTKDIGDTGVDKDGASGDFTLIFKIKKGQ